MSKATRINQASTKFNDFTNVMENPFFGLDLLRLVCGEKLGEGVFRAVYDFALKQGTVIKICSGDNVKANMAEFSVWDAMQYTEHKKWFAPIYEMSPGGHFLIQAKCKTIPNDFEMPNVIPDFFWDVKRENWGIYKGNLVCCDYQGIKRALRISFKKNQKAWW